MKKNIIYFLIKFTVDKLIKYVPVSSKCICKLTYRDSVLIFLESDPPGTLVLKLSLLNLVSIYIAEIIEGERESALSERKQRWFC